MKRHLTALALAVSLGLAAPASAQFGTILFDEDFNDLTLGDSVNERVSTIPTFARQTVVAGTAGFAPIPDVYSATAPGWTVDNNFNAFGDFNLGLNPDTDLSGDYNVNLDGPTTVGTVIGNTGILTQGSAADGVDEWEGWSFVDKQFWIDASGNQGRSGFAKGTGTVAVADPDEYDDLGTGLGNGFFNTGLSTDSIDISGASGFLGLTFDSSFLGSSGGDGAYDEAHTGNLALLGGNINNQTGVVYATYGGSNPRTERVFVADSDAGNADLLQGPLRPASPTLENDTNGTKQIGLSFETGVDTSVQLTFGMVNADNDWWWAIDNITLEDANGSLFTEDFESVDLGPSVNEQIATTATFAKVTGPQGAANTQPRPNSFTKTAPAGWDVTTTVPAIAVGNNDIGVYEWEGWSFADKAFWNFADTQDRQNFTNADGVFAIADGDEWDDLGNPDAGSAKQETLMETPAFDISGVAAGDLYMEFDSSWRDEDLNLAVITVDYGDGNGPIEVLRWESDDASPFFHDDAANEIVFIPLNNPAGAGTAKLAFLYEGGDDWWWAVDNIRVGAIPEPTSMGLSLLGAAGLGLVRRRK